MRTVADVSPDAQDNLVACLLLAHEREVPRLRAACVALAVYHLADAHTSARLLRELRAAPPRSCPAELVMELLEANVARGCAVAGNKRARHD
jgi:hypothetical protein